ncbi:MAG: hypothetical protein IT299_06520 [Dehalococcoidia bacterium]|nr:hypothetical protein [Dehalococcoidia bacterium]
MVRFALRHVAIRAFVGTAVAAITLAVGASVASTTHAQSVVPLPTPSRGPFAGVPPVDAGIAMLVTTEAATPGGLTTTLGDAGCQVETIAVLRPPSRVPGDPIPVTGQNEWSPFVAGAPAAVNEGFVRAFPTIPANTPFFLRCARGLTPEVDPANARYRIGTDVVTLVDGRRDIEAAPGSASRITTQLTDRRSYGDLDGGASDAAVILTHSTGGSGTFAYLGFQSGAQPASVGPTVLLGDRVTVTNVAIAHGRIMVTYLDRRPNEALAVAPSLPVTRLFAVSGGQLVEIGSLVG